MMLLQAASTERRPSEFIDARKCWTWPWVSPAVVMSMPRSFTPGPGKVSVLLGAVDAGTAPAGRTPRANESDRAATAAPIAKRVMVKFLLRNPARTIAGGVRSWLVASRKIGRDQAPAGRRSHHRI